jgi:hypothetical protein
MLRANAGTEDNTHREAPMTSTANLEVERRKNGL